MTEPSTVDDDIRLTLRLPGHLRDRLAVEAEKNSRSLNRELIVRLEKTLSDDDKTYEIDRDLTALWRKVEDLERTVADHDQHLFADRYDRN